MIHHGQGVTPALVAGEKLPLEVRAPQCIGALDVIDHTPGRRHTPAQTPGCYQSGALEHVVDRRARGYRLVRIALAQAHLDLLGSEFRASTAAKFDDRLLYCIGQLRRLAQGAAASLLEALRAFTSIALDPLVACLAAHAVTRAQCAEAVELTHIVGNKQYSLVHRSEVLPRHGRLLVSAHPA